MRQLYMRKNNNKILRNYASPAGDKGSQTKDIKTAKAYWHELKERSDE